jgi:hypothetical protein
VPVRIPAGICRGLDDRARPPQRRRRDATFGPLLAEGGVPARSAISAAGTRARTVLHHAERSRS